MIQSIDRKAIRRKAKEQFFSNMGMIILATIAFTGMAIITVLIENFLPIISFPITILNSIASISFFAIYLKIYRGDRVKADDIFYIFNGGKSSELIITWLFSALIGLALCIPFAIVIVVIVLTATYEVYALLFLVILLVMAGSIAVYILTMFLNFVYFFAMDSKKGVDVVEIFKTSWNVMKGEKLSFFILQLRFFLITWAISFVAAIPMIAAFYYELYILGGVLAVMCFVLYFYLVNLFSLYIAGFYNCLLENNINNPKVINILDEEILIRFGYNNSENDENKSSINLEKPLYLEDLDH